MTTLTATEAHQLPLTTDQSIEDRVGHLIGSAYKRQLWLLLLDADNRQLPVVVPIDDLPEQALGAELVGLASFSADLMTLHGAQQLIAVWERRGRGALNAVDATWPRGFAEACERRGLQLRAQLLCHTRGSFILSPTDYAATEPEPEPD